MFSSLRFRLTLWFVLLASLAYLITTIATGLLLHKQLEAALDLELTELIAENMQYVKYSNKELSFATQSPVLTNKPMHMLASIQLFDSGGKLIHQSGSEGVPSLFQDSVDIPMHEHHIKSKSKKLFDQGKLIGYLQLQLPTDHLERAEKERAMMLLFTTPVLLLLLSLGGYYFTSMASKPIEEAFGILRDFMIDAGHELNTPLSIAQAVVDNIERSQNKAEQMEKKLPTLKLSLTRMRNLVDDLSTLARLDSQRIKRRALSLLPLHEILSETIQQVQPLLEEHQISMHVNELAKVHIRGDAFQIQQVLINLLQNAIYYNNKGGSISISLSASERDAKLIISDTGIGISKEDLPKVFKRFFRAENSLSQRTAGSGLGLSITKAIVDFHQGKIIIESEPERGSTVTLRLPLVSLS